MDMYVFEILTKITMLLLLYACQTVSQFSEDSCNWKIWDGAEDNRGIRNIQPECHEGNIQWRNPDGAIRIVFTQHHAMFQLCFIAHVSKSMIKISSEYSTGLERLTLLTPDAPNTDGELCIDSTHGNDIVLFIENIRDMHSTSGSVELDYEIRKTALSLPMPSGTMEDCRPCTEDEIRHVVCYADFVAKGTIRHTEDKPHRKETEVHISLNKIYRQTHPVFKPMTLKTGKVEDHTVKLKTFDTSFKQFLDLPTHSGHVIVPQACGIKRGPGEFYFMGKIRLKRAHLMCAPRIKDFEQIWAQTMRSGENACIL